MEMCIMKDTSSIENLLRAVDCLRGLTDPEMDCIAIFMIKELQKKFNIPQKENPNLWKALETMANDLGVRQPFYTQAGFMQAYNFISDDINYEQLFYLKYKNQKNTSDGFSLLHSLLSQLIKKVSNPGKSFLIADAESFLPSLTDIVNRDSDCVYTLTTKNRLMFQVLKHIFDGYQNVRILQASICDYEFTHEKFDTILSVPVFGVKNFQKEQVTFLCQESEFIATENLLLHLSPIGRLIILLPTRITFGGGKIADLRRFIQNTYCIEEISEMPSGVISSTAVKTCLFTFSCNKKDDTSVNRFVFKNDNPVNRRLGTLKLSLQDETFVMKSELEDLGDWNIEKIFAAQDDDWKNYQESIIKKVIIKDVAEVFRGKVVNQKASNGSTGIISISDLTEFDVNYDNLEYINLEERKIASYLLKEGDLLLPARGTAIRCAVFKEQTFPCIASANLIVIRPKANVLSGTYLKVFLDSDMGKKLIKATQQGATIISISYKDLMNIEIPYLPFNEQLTISNQYNESLKKYKNDIEQAENEWSNVRNKLQSELKG